MYNYYISSHELRCDVCTLQSELDPNDERVLHMGLIELNKGMSALDEDDVFDHVCNQCIRCFKITVHLRLNQVVTILKYPVFLNQLVTKPEFSDLSIEIKVGICGTFVGQLGSISCEQLS